MYIPPSFKEVAPHKLSAVIEEYSFATVVTYDGTAPFASHLPVLFDAHRGPHGTLVSHVARANPQWKHFESGVEALTIFHGPHAYISPSWYETTLAVPTWNYVTVHAYGVPTLIEDEAKLDHLLTATIQKYESRFASPWQDTLPQEWKSQLTKAIVGFEIPITRIEGKFKLGQNRPLQDVQGVYEALRQSTSESARQLADTMAQEGMLAPRDKADAPETEKRTA